MKSEELKFFNPFAHVDKSFNRLPHWEQAGATYFITFRLADAVPEPLRLEWERERNAWLSSHPKPWDAGTEREYHLRFSLRMDKWLDSGHGACHLRQIECRDILATVIEKDNRGAGQFEHHAWVIMPNHVHVLVTLLEKASLAGIMQTWKGSSSNGINQILRRRGTLWQKGYFDRLIRDGEHFANCVRYIRRNPEKARLRKGSFTHYESDLARSFAGRR